MATTPTRIEIEAKLKEGSAEQAAGQLGEKVAAASEKSEKAAERRLKTILRENEAYREQIRLLEAISGSGTTRAISRGQAVGRSIRGGLRDSSVDQAIRDALAERADLQIAESRIRQSRLGRLRAGQAGVSAALANQALGFQAYQLERQIGGPVRGVSGGALLSLSNRFGGYEALAAGARKAGISLQEFIRVKSGATAAEARNERQLKALNKEQENTEKATKKATSGFGQMGRVLKSLLTAFIGFQAFRLIQNSLRDLIEFQAKLQNVRLGVAEILLVGNRFRDRITGQILPIADQVKQSFQLAARGTDALVEKAIQLGLPLDTLVASFQTVAGIAATSGVKFNDTLEIISQIGVVAQRLNIPFNQLTRSIDNIFTGLRVQQTQLGVILGLNQKIVQEQIQQGTLGQFLLERLQGVAETLPQNLKTFEGLRQSFRSLILDLSRSLTGGAFSILQDTLADIRERLLAFREDKDSVERLADSFERLAENVRKTVGWLAQNAALLKTLGFAGLGYRFGGVPGAVAGGLVGSGYLNFSTGVAAATAGPALYRAGRAAYRVGVGGALEAAAGAATGANVGSIGSSIVAAGGGFLARGAAIGSVALRFTGVVGLVITGLLALKKTIDDVNDYADQAAKSRRAARAFRRSTGAFALAQGLQSEFLDFDNLQNLAYNSGPVGRGLAQSSLRSIRERAAELQDVIPSIRDRKQQEFLQSIVDYTNEKLVEIESADPAAKVAQRLADQLKNDKKDQELAAQRLAVLKAQNDVAIQSIEGQRKLVELEKDKLDLQEQALRAASDRQAAEARAAFIAGPGAERSAAQSRIGILQGRLARADRVSGFVESLGRTDLAQALQQERARIQGEILALQQKAQGASIKEAQGERDAAQQRLADELKVQNEILPKRLAIEERILQLKIAQAEATAGAAAEEQRVAQQQLNLLDQRIRAANAEKATVERQTGQTLGPGDPLARTIADYEGLQAQFRLKQIEAQGRATAAGYEARILKEQGGLQGQRNQIAVDQQATKVAEATGQVAQAQQNVSSEQAKSIELQEQWKDVTLDQIEAVTKLAQIYQDLYENQKQTLGDIKQLLADILYDSKNAGNALLNFTNSLRRRGTEAIAGSTIDQVIGVVGGQQSIGGALRQIVNSASVFTPKQPTPYQSNQISQAIQQAGGIINLSGGGSGGLGALFNRGVSTGPSALSTLSSVGTGLYNAAGYLGLSGVLGGGAAATSGAAAAGGFTAGFGGQSTIIGTSAFGGGGLGAGAGAGASAAGAASGGVASALAAIAVTTQGLLAAARAERFARNNPRYNANNIAGASVGAFSSSVSGIPLGGLAKQGPAGQISAGALGGAVAGALIGGAAVAGVGVIVGAIIAAILIAVAQQKTAGSLIARALVPALKDIGFTRDVRLNGIGYGNVPISLTTGIDKGLRTPLPASYNSILSPALGAGFAARSTYYYNLGRGDVLAGLPKGVQASVLGTAAGLGLEAPDALDAVRAFTKTTAGDFTKGGYKILARAKGKDPRVALTQGQEQAALGALVAAFADLPASIDEATVALAAFGKEGEVSLKRLEAAAADAKSVIAAGIPKALSDAVKSGNPIEAANSLAQTFSDTFLNRLGQSLVNSGGIQKALSAAVALSTQAADAYAQGDYARGDALAAQAAQAFITGRNQFQSTANQLIPRVYGLDARIGVYGQGGIINPTGAGLPGFATPSAVRVPGPVGQPRLAVVHGDEVIREGAHNDQLVAAMNNVADAQRQLAQVLMDQSGGDTKVEVHLGTEVVASATRKADRRDSLGRGIKLPITTLGTN